MSKNIRGYFSSLKSSSVAVAGSKDISNSDNEVSDNEPVTKSHAIVLLKFIQLLFLARSVTILKGGKQNLSGQSMMKNFKVLSVNIAKSGQRQATKQEEHGFLNHLITGKKLWQK